MKLNEIFVIFFLSCSFTHYFINYFFQRVGNSCWERRMAVNEEYRTWKRRMTVNEEYRTQQCDTDSMNIFYSKLASMMSICGGGVQYPPFIFNAFFTIFLILVLFPYYLTQIHCSSIHTVLCFLSTCIYISIHVQLSLLSFIDEIVSAMTFNDLTLYHL